MRRFRWRDVPAWILAVASASVMSSPASSSAAERADPAAKVQPSNVALPNPLLRPHTVALVEAGIIALPNAPISSGQRGGSTPLGRIGEGDATVQTGLHLLYRATPVWAFGASALFGPSPTSDNQYGGLGGLRRTHSRSYLLLGADVRYFPLSLKWVEFWLGLTGGGVVIADRFTTDDAPNVPTILGQKDVTVRTEGLAVGAQAGVDWMFSDRFVAGLAVRGDRWFLPNTPGCTSIGDCATLVGIVSAIEVGLTVGYRIPL
ncbi:MAG: hypothetical protein U0169_09025 [Polyangiaceae bacterium]